MKLILTVGARPNFMKAAPIIDAIHEHNRSTERPIKFILVHSGQHYDEKMSKLFFEDLGLPKPDINLEVGSASHAVQTAEIMKKIEKVYKDEGPTHIMVAGDVNSTLACALVASKMDIRIIHIEAGLRSHDRTMPEEINRIVTDALSDYLFITEESARENLLREGVAQEKIFFAGNVMIDTLLKHKQGAGRSAILTQLGLKPEGNSQVVNYALLTLHRPSNVDNRHTLRGILEALSEISKSMLVIFPAHPRTLKRLREFDLESYLAQGRNAGMRNSRICCIAPLGYLDFLALMSHAKVVLTDSGGIQEETTVLGVPCVTLRENTERPVTVAHGTNIIAGTGKDNIIAAFDTSIGAHSNGARALPPLWDGRAAQRIIQVVAAQEPVFCRERGLYEAAAAGR